MNRTRGQIIYMISEWVLVVATKWQEVDLTGNPILGVATGGVKYIKLYKNI